MRFRHATYQCRFTDHSTTLLHTAMIAICSMTVGPGQKNVGLNSRPGSATLPPPLPGMLARDECYRRA